MTERHLFIKVQGTFWPRTKSYLNTPVKTTPSVIHKRRPGMGILRFAAYTFVLLLLLPLLLINGRDNVKLNKISHHDEPGDEQP